MTIQSSFPDRQSTAECDFLNRREHTPFAADGKVSQCAMDITGFMGFTLQAG